MLRGTIALSLLCYTCLSEARVLSDSTEVKIHSVYIEALGNGLVGSISYDRIVEIRTNFNLSVGLGVFILPVRPVVASIPIHIGALLSRNGKDHLEIGIGTTYVYGVYAEGEEPWYSSSTLFASMNVGYRRQKVTGGLFLRVGVFAFAGIAEFSSPPDYNKKQIEDLRNPFPSVGLGVGYTF